MISNSPETHCGYRFYISDDPNTLKPFLKSDDRRILSIQKICHSRIYLTRETCIRKGQKMRAVLVSAHSRKDLETCLHRIDDAFPHLYACANISAASAAIRLVQLKKYYTHEDLALGLPSTTVAYYQLSFNFDSGDMTRYEHWRKTSDAMLIKQLGCVLLVSMKDTPGAGFLRRYALISGERRKNVIISYKVFRATFIYLPEFGGPGNFDSLQNFST